MILQAGTAIAHPLSSYMLALKKLGHGAEGGDGNVESVLLN
jgi:hypothetical protein